MTPNGRGGTDSKKRKPMIKVAARLDHLGSMNRDLVIIATPGNVAKRQLGPGKKNTTEKIHT